MKYRILRFYSSVIHARKLSTPKPFNNHASVVVFDFRVTSKNIIQQSSEKKDKLQVILFEIDCVIFYTNLHEFVSSQVEQIG